MKRIQIIFAVIAIAIASFQCNAYLTDGTFPFADVSEISQVDPVDSAVYLDFKSVGNNLEITVHNIVPQQWGAGRVSSVPDIAVAYKQQDTKLLFDISAIYMISAQDSEKPHFTTPPYFDFKFTVPDIPRGAYSLEMFFDLFNMDRVTVSQSTLISETSSSVKVDNQQSDNIVREGVEWVLYNPKPDNRVKFYRMQFKGRTDVFFADSRETIKDAARLFLYTDNTLDETRDPVIAYLKPAGPLNARRIAADVDIPVGFWGSWDAGRPSVTTINPYEIFGKTDSNINIISLVNEYFTAEQLPEDKKSEAKWYWEDYLTGTMRPMFKQKYTDESTDSNQPNYSLTMSENMDGTGYQGRWESGVGPVGEDYASNLPYPVYSLPEGVTPTRLLYVRDINTNEVLWGDPKLDPAYNSVGELTNDNDGIAVYGGQGTITVESEGTVRIYTTAGTLLTTVSCPSTVSAAPGLYIAVSGFSSRKILVK